jgi:hypothetical protein
VTREHAGDDDDERPPRRNDRRGGCRLKSDWTGGFSAYDKVHLQVLVMADMLSKAIIANFPAKFHP